MSDDDLEFICYNCSADVTNPTIINECNYCDDCLVTCNCGTMIPNEDSLGGEYCTDCGFICGYCDDAYHNDYAYYVGGEVWCEGCRDNHSFYCDRCSENYSNGLHSSYYIQGSDYCEGCYEEIGAYCDDCDEYYHIDNPCDCRANEGECRCRGTIHDYSCKPTPIFYGNPKSRLFMGFELETEIHGDISDSAKYASEMLKDIAILKHDSSIGRRGANGFEIVTHPHSHQHYREHSDKLWQTINNLRENYGARSWDTDTCGLHIHVSRAGFSSGAHTHRFIAFIYKNSEMMMKFGGRKSSYARFNDVWRYDEYDKPYLTFKHKLDRSEPTERYSAVNTQNEHTLELRFFRGTMNPDGVLSALDLTHAIAEYTRDLRVSDVSMGALSWEWFRDYVSANNGLYPSLYNRMDKVQSFNILNPTKINA